MNSESVTLNFQTIPLCDAMQEILDEAGIEYYEVRNGGRLPISIRIYRDEE